MIFYMLAGLISAVVTFFLSWLIWKLGNRYRLYPTIRERDVHTRPTPRLGGIAMFIGMVAAFGFASQTSHFSLVFADPGPVLAILGAALIIVLIGVADDIWDLDWTTKLAGQIIAAGLLAWKGVQLLSLPIGGITVGSPYMSLIFTLLAVVLVMNAVNFIDGLDGLVAGVAIIANGTFFIYSYILAKTSGETEYFNLASLITVILVGACVGFLPLNWHPAKLFMGDSGALLVGLLMATSAISVTGQIDPAALSPKQLLPAFIPILLPFAILIVPLLDFALAVMRRLRAGKSPFAADRKHLHHRLIDMGHSHFQAVLIFYAWTAVVSLGCLLFMFIPSAWAATFLAIGIIACSVLTLSPLARRKAQATDAPATTEPLAKKETL
jgi:UDP-GlcNAc:undecaprenyl-phosphate GlcNAc-1-phosphate transferase